MFSIFFAIFDGYIGKKILTENTTGLQYHTKELVKEKIDQVWRKLNKMEDERLLHWKTAQKSRYNVTEAKFENNREKCQ